MPLVVALPVQWPQVVQRVCTVARNGNDVIDFPAILRSNVAMVESVDDAPELVMTPDSRVEAEDWPTFIPNLLNLCVRECQRGFLLPERRVQSA